MDLSINSQSCYRSVRLTSMKTLFFNSTIYYILIGLIVLLSSVSSGAVVPFEKEVIERYLKRMGSLCSDIRVPSKTGGGSTYSPS